MARSWALALLLSLLLTVTMATGTVVAEQATPLPRMLLTRGQTAPVAASGATLITPAPEWSASADSPPRPIPVKVEGVVNESYTTLPGMLVVQGTELTVTEDTLILPRGYTPQAGEWVTVSAFVSSTGVLARVVQIHMEGPIINPQPMEFRGIIHERILGMVQDDEETEEWTIAGRTVVVTKRTTVPNELVPGYYAHVWGLLTAEGKVQATKIDVERLFEAAARFEFEDVIHEVSASVPGIWVIGPVAGQVTAATEIVGAPEIGASAEVGGYRSPDGSLIFDQIRVSSEQQFVRIEGLIEAFEVTEAGGYTEGYLVIDGTRVEIEQTTLLDESGGRASPGMWAEVVARPFGEQTLIALRVRVTRPD